MSDTGITLERGGHEATRVRRRFEVSGGTRVVDLPIGEQLPRIC